MNSKKIIVSLIFIILGILVTAFFWRESILLSLLVIFLAYLKHKLCPLKKEFLWFILVAPLGATAEALMMYIGGNPWIYVNPSVFNIPLWLIPLWGYAGILFVTLYEGFTSAR